MKRPKSFRTVFLSTIIVFFTVILVIQCSILLIVNSFIDKANREYGESIARSLEYKITDRIGKTEKMSKIVSNNRDMQFYITSENEYDKKIAFLSILL